MPEKYYLCEICDVNVRQLQNASMKGVTIVRERANHKVTNGASTLEEFLEKKSADYECEAAAQIDENLFMPLL